MLLSKVRQLGSSTRFIIIAIVLVIITVGVITVVVKRGEQARHDQAIAQANQLAEQKAAQDAQNTSENTPAANPTVTTTPSTSNTSVSTQSGNAALPTTGPELDIIRIVAVGLLVGTAT